MTAHPTLRIIRDEHGVLSAVLRSIGLLLSESRRRGMKLDYKVLRAMLFYIDEFPERVHHPKESDLLFPALRARSTESAKVLERLDRDHATSHEAVRDLEHQVLALEMMEDAADFDVRRARFEVATQAYITAYLDHIRLEEVEVLPMAERLLTDGDWAELDARLHAEPRPAHVPGRRGRVQTSFQADPDDVASTARARASDGGTERVASQDSVNGGPRRTLGSSCCTASPRVDRGYQRESTRNDLTSLTVPRQLRSCLALGRVVPIAEGDRPRIRLGFTAPLAGRDRRACQLLIRFTRSQTSHSHVVEHRCPHRSPRRRSGDHGAPGELSARPGISRLARPQRRDAAEPDGRGSAAAGAARPRPAGRGRLLDRPTAARALAGAGS